MAGEICTSAGGFLVEIESPMEGEILRQNVGGLFDEFWIGGLKNESWRWIRNQRLIRMGFTDIDHHSEEITGTWSNVKFL